MDFELYKKKAREMRRSMDKYIDLSSDNPKEINDNVDILRPWVMGSYQTGNVRVYEGIPYRCAQSHDSTGNPEWNPRDAASLWFQYHGTSKETARPWKQPTGAHDMYKVDEYMVFTDGECYHCLQDTIYDPVQYSQAWEIV